MSGTEMAYSSWTVRKWVFHEPDGTDPSGYFVHELTTPSESRARARFYKLRDDNEYAELTRRDIRESVVEETHDEMPSDM